MSDNRPPLEVRRAVAVGEVDTRARLIEVVAVPYEQEAVVAYRGELWKELFERGAFDGIETRPEHIMVNREHTRGDTVGKVIQWWPERAEGLVGQVRVARTARGDDTLALAEDGMVRASVGYGVRLRDQILDREKMTRTIRRAFIDHLSLVENPAYTEAKVLSVRENDSGLLAVTLPPIETSHDLDELIAFLAGVRSRHTFAPEGAR